MPVDIGSTLAIWCVEGQPSERCFPDEEKTGLANITDQIFAGAPKDIARVLEVPQSNIAAMTENSARKACLVIVVYMPADLGARIVCRTDGTDAALQHQERVNLFLNQTVPGTGRHPCAHASNA
jgi:hypothetical protein